MLIGLIFRTKHQLALYRLTSVLPATKTTSDQHRDDKEKFRKPSKSKIHILFHISNMFCQHPWPKQSHMLHFRLYFWLPWTLVNSQLLDLMSSWMSRQNTLMFCSDRFQTQKFQLWVAFWHHSTAHVIYSSRRKHARWQKCHRFFRDSPSLGYSVPESRTLYLGCRFSFRSPGWDRTQSK